MRIATSAHRTGFAAAVLLCCCGVVPHLVLLLQDAWCCAVRKHGGLHVFDWLRSIALACVGKAGGGADEMAPGRDADFTVFRPRSCEREVPNCQWDMLDEVLDMHAQEE
jgi:hypothetical protein